MPITESRLSICIANAVNFLDENQLYYGEFRSYIANDEDMQDNSALLDSCIFVTSCILYALRFVNAPGLAAMKRTAFRFLMEEMKPPGIWTYFSSRNPTPIDPDLDVTALASFVLRELHPDIRAGCNLAVILGNRNEEGLFLTWLRRSGDTNDVDSVVNSNVLLYLGEREETRVVSDYLNAIVAERRESETYYYYLDDLALYYALSRAYFNGVTSLEPGRGAIVSRIADRQQADAFPGNELVTALAVCSLLNCGCDDLALLGLPVESLMDTQRPDGAWPRRAFYAGPPPPGPYKAWFGSEELTTGMCLEALARFRAFAFMR